MKKTLIIVGAVALLAAVLLVSLRGRGDDKGEPVNVEPVELREIRRVVTASGEVDPKEKVNISAHVVAKIERLYVDEGDEVAAGDPVLDLERQAFQAAVGDWRARLAQARAAVRQAEVEVADAELQQRRYERLAGEGVVSDERLEAARIATSAARVALEQARESVSQSRANLDKALDDLRKTTIYAPISGRVIDLRAEEGEVVVSGTMNNPASVIAVIADLSELLAVVDVDETEIVHVSVGQEVELVVDALPDVTWRGEVVEVGSSGFSRRDQPDVTFFEVEVLFAEPEASLKAGMSVRASIVTAVHPDALVVPIQAVVQRPPLDGGGAEDDDEEIPVVFVAADGTAAQRPVETGIADTTHVEITAGLEAGEPVVVGPYRTLRDLEDGDAVRPAEEDGEDGEDAGDAEEADPDRHEDDGEDDDGS